jgi:DNA-binding winged helix-turn-helix (wHTH) protein/TolB-like protein/Tfp pilus assembly protein PilF
MNLLNFGPFTLDMDRRVLLREGTPVQLTPKTYETLALLVRNSGRVVEKSELMDALWPDAVVEENNLNQQISALRKVLGDRAEEGRYIKTVPGHGYRFVASPTLPVLNRIVLRKPVTLIVLAALAAILLAAGGLWLWRSRTSHAQPRSIAVLPFKSLSGGDEYLGLGLTDVLITRLSNVRGMIVRPTSAVRRYGQEADPLGAGRQLHVDAVLDGTIQRMNDRVRVTVRLLNVADGAALWGDTFDDRFTGFFAVEDSISERLTRALALRLSEEERKGLTARGTSNLEAHQWYLKGRYYSAQWTVEGFTRALDAFHRAIAIDPTYALAYAGQADAYYRATTIHLTPQEGVPRARAAALAALRLDDGLAEAHAALGIIKFRYDWDFAGAEREFRRAIALNAEDVEAHQWYSEYLTAFGRVAESVAEAKTAQEIDPLSPEVAWDLGLALLFGNRNREAIEQLKNAVDLDPRFWLTHAFLAWAYGQDGNYELAYAEYARARALDDNADVLSQWILVAHQAGRNADAQRMLDDLLQRAKTRYVAPFYIAAAYIAVGENDRGFDWLQKALAERNELLVFIKVAPSFRSVRGDRRFVEILRRIGIS